MFTGPCSLLHIHRAFHGSSDAGMDMGSPFPLKLSSCDIRYASPWTSSTRCASGQRWHACSCLRLPASTQNAVILPLCLQEPRFSVPDGVHFSCSITNHGPRVSRAVEESDDKHGLSVGEIWGRDGKGETVGWWHHSCTRRCCC